MRLSYYLSKFREHYREWRYWKNTVIKIIIAVFFSVEENNSIWEEDWQNLIILDACRFDTMRELYRKYYDEEIQKKLSIGTATSDFLTKTFNENFYENLVYITANPVANQTVDGHFAEVISVWDENWDFTEGPIPPSTTYLRVLEAIKRHKDMRIIVHFLQPHHPYPNQLGIVDKDAKPQIWQIGSNKLVKWDYFRLKKLPMGEFYQGYIKNLLAILPYARRLADLLPGKTIITSDHGEAFGELVSPLFPIRVYGHPEYVRIRPTIEVPWIVIENQNNSAISLQEEIKKIKEEMQLDKTQAEKDFIKSRIRRLRIDGGIQ